MESVESVESNSQKKIRVKVFNKIYADLQDAFRRCLKKSVMKTYTVKKYEEIERFDRQMNEHMPLYSKKDALLFQKVMILHRVFVGQPTLSNKNTEVVWKFIDVLYNINNKPVKRDEQELNLDLSKIDANGLENLVKSLKMDEASGLKSIMDDIASQVGDTTNISIADLMSGKSGIDLQAIIQKSSKNLEDKIKSGEIDKTKIEEAGAKIQKIFK